MNVLTQGQGTTVDALTRIQNSMLTYIFDLRRRQIKKLINITHFISSQQITQSTICTATVCVCISQVHSALHLTETILPISGCHHKLL